MEFKIILVLTFLLITIFIQTTSVNAISPLHVEGKDIKNESGCVVYLRGVGRWAFYYTPTGWFMSGTMWEDDVWDESIVRFQLQTIKSWGANHIRFHTVGDWWKQDTVTYKGYTGSYRNNLRRVIEIAGEEGLYVIVNHYSPISYQTSPNHGSGMPYAPYSGSDESPGATPAMHSVFPNKQAFIDYWANGVDGVADVLGDLPNVIFEIQNEPHALGAQISGYDPVVVRDDFMDAQQQSITAIRNIANSQNLIMVTWGVGMIPSGGLNIFDSDMSWAYTYSDKLVDPLNNLVYVGHLYRRPFHTDWAVDKNTLRAQFENIFVKQVSQEHPVIFGEMGVSMAYAGANLPEELTWARNTLEICNEWGIGYSAWVWEPMPYADQDWWLYEDLSNITPTAWGQVLIDATAEGGTTVCNGTVTTTVSGFPTTSTTTTTIPPGYKTISGQLMNTTGTIGANITIYNQGTSIINASDITDSFGSYNISLWLGIYDLQYNILEFFISNFFIKLISLNIVSDLPNVVNYVTGSSENITFTVNISTNQEIQVYSEEKPKTVKVNGIELTEGTLPLSSNEWTYISAEQKLRMIVNSSVGTTTSTSTTTSSTTTTMPVTTTTITIPGAEKTFGKTDKGINEQWMGADSKLGSRFQIPEDGTVRNITVYLRNVYTSGNMKAALYSDNGGVPDSLITYESSPSSWDSSYDDWLTINLIPASITGNTYYWLILKADANWYSYYDDGDINQWQYLAESYMSGWGDPYGAATAYVPRAQSIYATYTTS